jgi:hypothetical protein
VDPDPKWPVERQTEYLQSMLRSIRMFLGLPDPDPLVRGMDPAINHQAKIVGKTFISTVL